MSHPELKQELANSLTHGFGVLLSFVGIPILLSMAVLKGTQLQIWGVGIFGVSVFMVYLFSTLYHSIPNPFVKRVMRKLDHISIYFLIAGSYTPFMFIYLNRGTGYTMLAIVWSIALAGCVFKIFYTGRFARLSTILYVAMGWMAIFVGKSIVAAMPMDALLWLLAGGIAYTGGVAFYVWEKLPYHHAIWHVFVLAGTICHYISLLLSLGVELPSLG